jgi:hypothetical protein
VLQRVGDDHELDLGLFELFGQQELVPQMAGEPIGIDDDHGGNGVGLHQRPQAAQPWPV